MKKFLKKIYKKFHFTEKSLIRNFLIVIYYYSGYPFYLIYLFLNKPYIGNYLFSNQESSSGKLDTINLKINKIKKKKLSILEIGVYCGQNTLNLNKILNKKEVRHYCVDIFKEFKISSKNNTFHYKKIYEALKERKVLNLFRHNIKNLSNEKYHIFEKKMSSRKFFLINKIKFDLIIIDASHKFEDVSYDLKNSVKFLNNNGIIIFDDYELEAKNISLTNLQTIKNIDLFFDDTNEIKFHPGVTMAIKVHFGNLKSFNGLGGIIKKNGQLFDFFFMKQKLKFNNSKIK